MTSIWNNHSLPEIVFDLGTGSLTGPDPADCLARFGGAALKLVDPSWVMVECFSDCEKLETRLREASRLAERANNVVSLHHLHAHECDLLLSSAALIPRAYKAWNQNRGRIDAVLLSKLQQSGALDRTIILGLTEPKTNLTFRFIGLGFTQTLGPSWQCNSLGRDHDDNPSETDLVYSRWCEEAYWQVLETKEPRLQAIDAVAQYYDSGRKRRRVQYERLLLPARLSDDTPAIIIVTEVVPALISLS